MRSTAACMLESFIPATTRLWASCGARGECSLAEAKPPHEPEPDPARPEMAFEHGDLRHVDYCVRDDVSVCDRGRSCERLGDDLPWNDADDAVPDFRPPTRCERRRR